MINQFSRQTRSTVLGRSLVLIAVLTMSIPTYALPRSETSIVPSVRCTEGYASLDTYLSNGRSVEHLTGAAALAHLQNLRARKPDVFKKIVNDLSARGFEPTDRVTVYRSKRVDKKPAHAAGNNVTIDAGEGEVVFWSWDDGDDSTWEGSMYAENYETTGYLASEGQIDTVTNDTVWDETVVYEPRGEPDQQLLTSGTEGARQFIKDWLACVATNCLMAVGGCVLAGPLYIECVVLYCHLAVIGCALGEIIRRL